MKSWSLDEWRKYFGSANSDIFEIIEHAIIVAASDCPKEFRVRRDGIAERLFSCRLTRCVGFLFFYGDVDGRVREYECFGYVFLLESELPVWDLRL